MIIWDNGFFIWMITEDYYQLKFFSLFLVLYTCEIEFKENAIYTLILYKC